MSFEITALLLAWIAIALLGLAMSGVLRQLHALTETRSSRNVGPARGESLSLFADAEGTGSLTRVVLFVDADCDACAQLLPHFSALARRYAELDFALISSGTFNDALLSERVRLYTDQSGAFERYRILVTPFGIVLDGEGKVVEALPIGSMEMLTDLVDGVVEGSAKA